MDKKNRRLLAAVTVLVVLNIVIWGLIFLAGGDDNGQVLQLWGEEDLDLESEDKAPDLRPEISSEQDAPEEFQIQKEEIEVELP